ncbi:MAG: hypothetical protein AABY89_12765 [Acidobacteriota bacterium]
MPAIKVPPGALQPALDLFEVGIELMRQNLRRRHPDATAEDIVRRLHQWLHERPGATLGDCPGRALDLGTRT